MNKAKVKTLGIIIPILGCLSALTGCAGPLVLNVEDVVALPGKQTQFTAWVEQGRTLALKRDVKKAVIRFYVNGASVGQATTDKDGHAIMTCTLPPSNIDHFEAKTQVGELSADKSGTIYRWSQDKTIVAVDIDDTISNTDYSDLFISHVDKNSEPIGNSRDVLEAISKNYQIYYFSARPRFLHDKTKQWLQDNRFPMGPIAHATSFEACLRQTTYKRRMLADLRARFPNMLIGIGDRDVDDKAYNESKMLTVLVNTSKLVSFRSQCVMCEDWNGVNRFFSTQGRHISDPMRLTTFIENHSKFDTPVLIGEPTGPRASLK